MASYSSTSQIPAPKPLIYYNDWYIKTETPKAQFLFTQGYKL